MLLDEIGREAIVPGGHRGVCREHNLRGRATERLVGADAFCFHPLTDEFQCRKGAVSLVQMRDPR